MGCVSDRLLERQDAARGADEDALAVAFVQEDNTVRPREALVLSARREGGREGGVLLRGCHPRIGRAVGFHASAVRQSPRERSVAAFTAAGETRSAGIMYPTERTRAGVR